MGRARTGMPNTNKTMLWPITDYQFNDDIITGNLIETIEDNMQSNWEIFQIHSVKPNRTIFFSSIVRLGATNAENEDTEKTIEVAWQIHTHACVLPHEARVRAKHSPTIHLIPGYNLFNTLWERWTKKKKKNSDRFVLNEK